MKYCLRSRVSKEYLQKADAIKFEYRDRRAIPDYIREYPDAEIILQITFGDTDIEWDDIYMYHEMSEKFICCISNITDAPWFKDNGVPFFYGYPVNNYKDLRVLIDLGVKYIKVEGPLFFDLVTIRKITDIPILTTANVAADGYMPYAESYSGTWIRPEDVETYEGYINLIEFEDCDTRKEQALYRIYAEEHEWPGLLNLIITNFKEENVLNRLILPETAEMRLRCRQKCAIDGRCQLCKRAFQMANYDLIKNYAEAMKLEIPEN